METELQNLKKDYTDLLKVVNELKTELKEKSKSRSRSRSRRPSRTRSPSEKGRFPNTDSEDHLTSGKESDGDSDLSDTKLKKQHQKKNSKKSAYKNVLKSQNKAILALAEKTTNMRD